MRHTTGSESLLSPILPTLKARDAQAEGYEAGLRRSQPQVGTIVKGIVEGDERVTMLPTPTVFHTTMNDESIETFEARQARSSTGQIGMSLGVALRYELTDEGLLRTPSVTDSTGGAISENQARERGRMVKVADQAAQLAFENGLKVSPSIEAQLGGKLDLLPTPNTMEHLPPREGEARERQLRRGSNGSRRTSSGNLREVVTIEMENNGLSTDTNNEGL